MGRACDTQGRQKKHTGKLEGKIPLGRYRHKWQDNNKMDPKIMDGKMYTAFTWLRTGTSGGLL
jgi:hypothetical protein